MDCLVIGGGIAGGATAWWLSRLGREVTLLEQFEREATIRGAVVHWARDADEHNRIVHGILSERGITRLVKSKSMLTEECHLNPELERAGIEVVDTDLGERIVQLAQEPPSHIVLPAVHMKREQRRHREMVEAIRQHGPPPGYIS